MSQCFRNLECLLSLSIASFIALSGCQQTLDELQNEDQPIGVKSISLDVTQLELVVGEERDLRVTLSPVGAQPTVVEWFSSDADIVTVKDGKIRAVYTGIAEITAKINKPELSARCIVEVKPDMTPVDLGLGALWAPMNVGASIPSEVGDYFAWGEIAPKDDYSQMNYKFWDGLSMTKYYHDRKFMLDEEDDAARTIMGSEWRIPTEAELQQLIDHCTWSSETLNGTEGARVTGPNGQSIFLPFSGGKAGEDISNPLVAWYWSNEQSELSVSKNNSLQNSLNEKLVDGNPIWVGFPIRAVKSKTIESISIETDSMHLNVDEIKSVPLRITPSLATASCLEWKSEDEDIAIVSNGVVLGLKVGQTTITGKSPDGMHSVECVIIVQNWSYPEAESVDLGLSVEWASWNLGATCPEEAGDYFAWGEVEHKSFFGEDNYMFYDEYKQLKKYSRDNPFLAEEDDVATRKWSNGWRMPTQTEIEELVKRCTWTWTSQNGVEGMVASYRGKSLFFPASHPKNGYTVQKNRPSSSYLVFSGATLYQNVDNRLLLSTLCLRGPESSFAYLSGNPSLFIGFHIRPVRFPVSRNPSLNLKTVKLEKGETLETIYPEESRGYESLTWTNSNDNVVSFENGKVTAKANGKAIITAKAERGGASASCEVVVDEWSYPVADAIDLGLSVKWASWNVGANYPGDLGDFIIWGVPGHNSRYSRYEDYKSYIMNTYVTGSKVLKKEDDIASVQWGSGWRTPSKAEFEELIENCSKEYAYIDNNHGILLTGPNGNSIFLPAAPGFTSLGWSVERVYQMGAIHNGVYWSRDMSENGMINHLWFMANWTVRKEFSDYMMVTDMTFSYPYAFPVRPVKE